MHDLEQLSDRLKIRVFVSELLAEDEDCREWEEDAGVGIVIRQGRLEGYTR